MVITAFRRVENSVEDLTNLKNLEDDAEEETDA